MVRDFHRYKTHASLHCQYCATQLILTYKLLSSELLKVQKGCWAGAKTRRRHVLSQEKNLENIVRISNSETNKMFNHGLVMHSENICSIYLDLITFFLFFFPPTKIVCKALTRIHTKKQK